MTTQENSNDKNFKNCQESLSKLEKRNFSYIEGGNSAFYIIAWLERYEEEIELHNKTITELKEDLKNFVKEYEFRFGSYSTITMKIKKKWGIE